MKISKSNWHELSLSEVEKVFKEEFRNVKALPNIALVKELQALKNATLELVKSNEKISVYRIVETDRVFEMFSSGVFEEYDTYENYENNKSVIDTTIVD